jgi:hypothetical protein
VLVILRFYQLLNFDDFMGFYFVLFN